MKSQRLSGKMTNFLPQIEKLKGRENFDTWRFAVQAYLEHEGLFKYCTQVLSTPTEPEDTTATTAASKEALNDQKTKAKLILLIEPVNYVHVRSATTAAEVWNNLSAAFEDNGLMRRIGLLQTFAMTKLSDCESVDKYVDTIISTAMKLRNVGMDVPDEWVGAFLLMGLPPEYAPMIMGIQSSGIKIGADSIKTKLLQDVKCETSNESALFGRHGRDLANVKCYKCNRLGHFAVTCRRKKQGAKPEKPKDASSKGKTKFENALLTSFVAKESFDSSDWFIDSGASAHMTMREDLLEDVKNSSEGEVIVADNTRLKVKGQGNVQLSVLKGETSDTVLVRNVQYIPGICANLLSVSQMVKAGNKVIFDCSGCRIFNAANQLVAQATLNNNMYRLDLNIGKCMVARTGATEKQILWHRRFGHASFDRLKKLNDKKSVGTKFSSEPSPCEICVKGKHARKSFNHTGTRATELLELVHSDVCGKMSNTSLGGGKYFLLFLDDFSRKVFVYIIKEKSDVYEKFVEFKQLVENQTGKRIKTLRTDNGTEYLNDRMRQLMSKSGIRHETTTPYTPQQNGMAERMNRTLVEKARCLLFDAKLSARFWAEAINTAAHLVNHLPASGTGRLPQEIWSGREVNMADLRVFGCKAMAHIPKENRKKFDEKSTDCIFVGYSDTSKAYRLYDQKKRKIIVSRDVVFFENHRSNEVIDTRDLNFDLCFDDSESVESSHHIAERAAEKAEQPTNEEQTSDLFQSFDEQFYDGDGDVQHESTVLVEDESSSVIQIDSSLSENEVTTAEPAVREELAAEESVASSSNMQQPQPSSSSKGMPPPPPKVRRPRSRSAVDIDSLRRSERLEKFKRTGAMAVTSAEVGDPCSIDEALSRADANAWREAMQSEYDSLIENKTWELVKLPPQRRPIDNKWVFKVKKDSSGNITRYKARLVIKGCAQRKGLDYTETFAPVVRYTSIRFLLSIAAKYNMQVDQMDAVTAFLHGELEEDIFMLQPEGFADGSDKVCRLKKSLYGLKQASRVWNAKLNEALIDFGLTRSKYDPLHLFLET